MWRVKDLGGSAVKAAGDFIISSLGRGKSLCCVSGDIPAFLPAASHVPVQGGARVPLETLDDQLQHLLVLQEPGQGFGPEPFVVE